MFLGAVVGTLTLGPIGALGAAAIGHLLDEHINEVNEREELDRQQRK